MTDTIIIIQWLALRNMRQLMQKTSWWGQTHFCIVVGISVSLTKLWSRARNVQSDTASGVVGQANSGGTVLPALSAGEILRWSVCLVLGLSPQSLRLGLLGKRLFKLGEALLH